VEANDKEFLRALHEEKIRTRSERSGYLTQKLALATVFLGVSIVNMRVGFEGIYWLLYFIPMFAVCYDLFFMSADLRIKKLEYFWAGALCSPWQEKQKSNGKIFANLTKTAALPPLQICSFLVWSPWPVAHSFTLYNRRSGNQSSFLQHGW
jgi:hypothetical protein